MASTAWPTSSGAAPRPSGVPAHCRANCSALCRGLGKVGPGPMAFTRTRGAKASAMDCVSAHSPAFDRV